jgi:hypothetical protein
VVLDHVAAWELARDDRKVYVMRGQRDDASFLVADFPAGGGGGGHRQPRRGLPATG